MYKRTLAVAIAALSLTLTSCTVNGSVTCESADANGVVTCKATPQSSSSASATATPSDTSSPTATATVAPTQTSTPTPTGTPTASTSPTASQSPTASPTTTTPPATTAPASNEKVLTNAFVTGYTWYDNTPPGTSQIAYEDVRPGTGAGGTGTYLNPITIAVGHVKNAQGVSTPDYPKGTIFYIPNVRKYFIVEDLCGDGNTPQNIPCHNLDDPNNDAPAGATTWVDIWVDGRTRTETQATACANKITKLQTIIQNPASNYVVVTGALADTQAVQGNGTLAYCPTYSNTAVKQ